MELIDVKKLFLFYIIPTMNSYECDLPFIRFVFDSKDISEFQLIVLKDYEHDKEKGLVALRKLLRNNRNQVDDSIRINNSDEFFKLLGQILEECEKKGLDGKDLLLSIWLRMGVEDLNNVEDFLKKQLEFIKNLKCISTSYTSILEDKDTTVEYRNHYNLGFCETSSHIEFKVNNKEHGDYYFPVVYYGLSLKDDKPKCYIYAIQNLHGENKNTEFFNEYLRPIKKGLRNKYVSKDFVLTLGLFLDMIYSKGIDEIRVPIYQVFNYRQHEFLSDVLNVVCNDYEEEEKKILEEKIKNNDIDDNVSDYIHNKILYDRFVGKEDMISRNKTERFIYTFMVLNEIFDNIEICNEPFIQGDELIIKIKKSTNILEPLEEKNKEY